MALSISCVLAWKEVLGHFLSFFLTFCRIFSSPLGYSLARRFLVGQQNLWAFLFRLVYFLFLGEESKGRTASERTKDHATSVSVW